MNSSDPVPTHPPALRVLRVIVRVLLAAIVTFFVGLVLLSISSGLRGVFGNILGWGDPEKANPRLAVALALAAIVLIGVLSWLGRRLPWRALAIGYAAVAPILIYLAVDSATLHRPQTMEEFSPSFPGAEASYTILVRYGNQHPAGREFKESKLMWVALDPQKPEPWVKFVTGHRTEIEAEWLALAPVRAWWLELNAFDRIGDLMPPVMNPELLAFRPVRQLSQRACAVATLQALDGRGDEAMETIIPLLEVARKLQPSARSLVRQMMAIVIERMAMQTAGFVLDHATVSPGLRARLAAALTAPGGGEAGARRLLAIEYVLAVNVFRDRPLGDCIEFVAYLPPIRRTLNALGPFVYNPRATFNLYADLTTDEEEIVGRRQLAQHLPRQERFFEHDAAPGFKNIMGVMFLQQTVPLHTKVAEVYWQTQDMRAALLARVRAP